MIGASNVMQERESVTDVSRVTPAQRHNIFVLKSVKNLCHVYLYRAGLSSVSAAIRSPSLMSGQHSINQCHQLYPKLESVLNKHV